LLLHRSTPLCSGSNRGIERVLRLGWFPPAARAVATEERSRRRRYAAARGTTSAGTDIGLLPQRREGKGGYRAHLRRAASLEKRRIRERWAMEVRFNASRSRKPPSEARSPTSSSRRQRTSGQRGEVGGESSGSLGRGGGGLSLVAPSLATKECEKGIRLAQPREGARAEVP
jgi:hypothetical protein